MNLLPLLAQAAKKFPTPEEVERLHYALILIIAIGVVGILLILAMLAAWRNFHKRIAELEAERDERRNQDPHADLWQASGDRVELEPTPGSAPGSAPGNTEGDTDDGDDEDDDPDLYGKDWEPGDDDENPDDDKGW